ncbi:MAG: TIGR04282 family arsenosugar biosynthesis glycosyltransferase [Parvularculaceae bacterium]
MSWSPKLIVFVKAPKIGRAKTRLAKDIGAARAATFYRQATAKLLGRMADRRWETLLAVDPAPYICDGFTNLWPPNFQRIGQGKGDLGQRMGQQFTHAKPGPVIIIGSDAPGVTRALIANGFANLRGSDAVFGPAEDGGYWLIGMARRRCAPNLFHQVRWSTEYTLQDTLTSLPFRFRISHLPKLSDIDDGKDLANMPGALLRSHS